MPEPIPQEEDITKTKLWERIDHLRSVFESHKGEILYKIETIAETLKADTGNLNSEHSILLHKRMEEIDQWLRTFRLEVKTDLAIAIKNMEALFQKHLSDVEKLTKEMKDSIPNEIKLEANELFASNENRILELEEEFKDLSSGVNESLSKYQVETRTKIGELRTRSDRIVSKLRDGFQDL